MSKCKTCGQPVNKASRPVTLDSTGRCFDVTSVLLYMAPVYSIKVDGLTLAHSMQPITFKPTLIILNSIESDLRIWVAYGREYDNWDNEYQIDGECGKRNRTLYKIANNVGEL